MAGQGSDHIYGVVDDAGARVYYDGVAVIVAGLVAIGDRGHLLQDGNGERAELVLPAGWEHTGAVVLFAQAGRKVAGAGVVLGEVVGVLIAEEVVAVVAVGIAVAVSVALVVVLAVALIVPVAAAVSVIAAVTVVMAVAVFTTVALGGSEGRGEEEGSEGERGEKSEEFFQRVPVDGCAGGLSGEPSVRFEDTAWVTGGIYVFRGMAGAVGV